MKIISQQRIFLNFLSKNDLIKYINIKDHYEFLIQHHNQLLDYQQKHHVYREFRLLLIDYPLKKNQTNRKKNRKQK